MRSRRAEASASSTTRASTRFWLSVCGRGLNSPLETIWVGTGDGKAARSAGATSCNSFSVSQVDMAQRLGDLEGSGTVRHAPGIITPGQLLNKELLIG